MAVRSPFLIKIDLQAQYCPSITDMLTCPHLSGKIGKVDGPVVLLTPLLVSQYVLNCSSLMSIFVAGSSLDMGSVEQRKPRAAGPRHTITLTFFGACLISYLRLRDAKQNQHHHLGII
jgi:hypothetical protein